jgi:hypothetical protein
MSSGWDNPWLSNVGEMVGERDRIISLQEEEIYNLRALIDRQSARIERQAGRNDRQTAEILRLKEEVRILRERQFGAQEAPVREPRILRERQFGAQEAPVREHFTSGSRLRVALNIARSAQENSRNVHPVGGSYAHRVQHSNDPFECFCCLGTNCLRKARFSCGHEMCADCCLSWYHAGNRTCPLCRQVFTNANFFMRDE